MSDKRKVVVKEVLGKKQLVVSGADLLGRTDQVREKVEDLEIEVEDHQDGEIVGEIEVEEK